MIRADSRFLLQDVGGTNVLVPLDTKVVDLNGILTLNATAAFLWELLGEQRTAEDLAVALADRFSVALPEARSDVAAFIASISELGLLQ